MAEVILIVWLVLLFLFKAEVVRLLLLYLLFDHPPHCFLLRHFARIEDDLAILTLLDSRYRLLVIAAVSEGSSVSQLVPFEVFSGDALVHPFEGLSIEFDLVPGPRRRRIVLVGREALELMYRLNAFPRKH